MWNMVSRLRKQDYLSVIYLFISNKYCSQIGRKARVPSARKEYCLREILDRLRLSLEKSRRSLRGGCHLVEPGAQFYNRE